MQIHRFDGLDALRGFAMVWMTLFHFSFDLNHFGYWQQNFLTDPFWTTQRTLILSLFLFTAGIGQAIAIQQEQSWGRFWRRWSVVAGSALLVSVGSYLMYPKTYIYFGVLHGMAMMLLVTRLTARWGAWLWALGLLAIAMKYIAENNLFTGTWADFFNEPPLNWLGLITQKPVTEDYVPLFPWLGVMWWGLAAGQWIISHRAHWLKLRGPLAGNGRSFGKSLAVLGRFSLGYYLIHQPLLIGALMALAWLTR
jgi:uncharacterized membrane protein